MTDPIGDMFTRIRNALMVRHKDVEVSSPSRVKLDILKLLKEEGYIKGYTITEGNGKKKVRVDLKYSQAKESIITEIKRVSKPGKRVYVGRDEVPKVMNGLGIAIISTSKGIVTDREARELGLGGELFCTIF